MPFNNALFSPRTISPMTEPGMHPATARLYRAAKDLKGVTGQSALARLLNVSPQVVKNWESRGISKPGALMVEDQLGVSAIWILNGNGDMLAPNPDSPSHKAADAPWSAQERQADYNVEAVERKRRVPLISWVKAGSWGAIEDQFHPGEADEWADAYDTRPGDNSFALRVTGDSMTNPIPGDRSFPEGTVIIVDPGRSADAGDFVIAKDVATQQATFKRLVSDGGRWYLKPLNPTYPTVEIDDPNVRVIGKVVEYQTRGKL